MNEQQAAEVKRLEGTTQGPGPLPVPPALKKAVRATYDPLSNVPPVTVPLDLTTPSGLTGSAKAVVQQLLDAKDEIATLRARECDLEGQVADRDKAIETHVERVVQLEDEAGGYRDTAVRVGRVADERSDEVRRLHTTIRGLEDDRDEAADVASAQDGKIVELDSLVDLLRNEVDGADKEIARLRSLPQNSETKASRLQGVLDNVRGRLGGMTAARDQANNDRDSVERTLIAERQEHERSGAAYRAQIKTMQLGRGRDEAKILGMRSRLNHRDDVVIPDLLKRLADREEDAEEDVEHETTLCLDGARDAVTGDRARDYGKPSVNHEATARGWAAYLRVPDTFLDARDVCQMNIIQKASRDRHYRKPDNPMDQAGYSQNAAWVGDPREGKTLEVRIHGPRPSAVDAVFPGSSEVKVAYGKQGGGE